MTSYKQIENPFFHDNISKGEISYHNNYPYIKYFDVDANGIRCASRSWKISEVRI